MTKQDRQLLFKDLCSRLPYGIKVEFHTRDNNVIPVEVVKISKIDNGALIVRVGSLLYSVFIENIKPYLRPMSSMTEEEKQEMSNGSALAFEPALNGISTYCPETMAYNTFNIDFCLSHHLDYRGLIEKGLALEAPENMYK